MALLVVGVVRDVLRHVFVEVFEGGGIERVLAVMRSLLARLAAEPRVLLPQIALDELGCAEEAEDREVTFGWLASGPVSPLRARGRGRERGRGNRDRAGQPRLSQKRPAAHDAVPHLLKFLLLRRERRTTCARVRALVLLGHVTVLYFGADWSNLLTPLSVNHPAIRMPYDCRRRQTFGGEADSPR